MTRAEGRTREPKVDTTPLRLPSDQDSSGRTLGAAEIARLEAVIASGTLTATKGAQTPELEARLAAWLGRAAAVACSSGTAAVHAAVAAVDPEPGDEIVTSPITDMGAISPILFHGAIPRFADVDPATGMVTADTVAAVTGPRTRAVVVTHLFGTAAAVDDIVAAAGAIPVIEDCAQAYGAERRGRRVGTIGALGCFSLQQGKHITTGEGGFVVGDDPGLVRRVRMFVNKAWPYGESDPDHEFLALNLRISELQSAVANAQLDGLTDAVERRQATVAHFLDAIAGLPGVSVTPVPEGDVATWWKVPLLVDPARVPGGPQALAAELATLGVASAPRYIQKPAFACRVFTEQRTFGSSRWPFTLATPEALDYSPARFPGTTEYLERVLVLPWNERYEPGHADALAAALRAALHALGADR
jgi:dTDP-4-amino-4,6-dideoxygalactose transaminase